MSDSITWDFITTPISAGWIDREISLLYSSTDMQEVSVHYSSTEKQELRV